MSSRISRSSLSCLLLLSAVAGCGGPGLPSASKVQDPRTAVNVAMTVEGSAPTGDDTIVVFPERDMVAIEAFTPGTRVQIGVFRQDTAAVPAWHQIGLAEGTTDATGLVEVNHAGSECWIDPFGTPDILPGDAVVVEELDAAGTVLSHSETIVRDIACGAPRAVYNPDGTATVTITGTLPPLPPLGMSEADYLEEFEERLINPDLPDRRDRRATFGAPGGNVGGRMTFTDRARGEWVATYTNVPAAEVPLYLAAESRILWRSTPLLPETDDEEAPNNEITIFENPGTPGPAEFRCSPFALNAFDESPKFVNATSATELITMKGKAQGTAQGVQILVDGVANGTPPVFDPLCVLPKTWTWTPGSRYSDLLGTNTSVTLTPLVTLDGFQLRGAPSKIILDQTPPVVSAIVMSNGRFAVNADEPLAEARFVFNGTANETSPLYTGPVTIPAGASVSVWAKDLAGNVAGAGGQAPTGDVVAPNLTVSNSAPQGQVARFRNPGIVTVVSDDAAATVTIRAFRNAETAPFQTVTNVGSATISIQRPNGGRSPVYRLEWSATDAAGNTATGSSQYRF
jgi:predicted small lipoprotein YifL